MIIISGAGIAGLTLALSCHQAGIPFRIFERAAELKPLGVGINVQPHAVRELFDLGLEPELDRIGVRSRELVYYSKSGNRIWAEPRGMDAGYNWPQYSLHRGQLHMLLYRALLATGQTVHLGCDIHNARELENGNGVEVFFRDGDNEQSVTADVLVAADGIHSSLRKRLAPNEGDPIWGGAVLWRGTTWGAPFLGGATVAYAGHQDQKFVTYPITPPDADGKVLINWIAELRRDPASGHKRESYSRKADLNDFLPAFETWKFDFLDVPALIRSAGECFEYPMVDRDPLDRWTEGHMTLLGDAAHPMYPIGSNGASQAILDARVLVREFLAHRVGRTALLAYEENRRPATNQLVLANRGNGPDQVMQIVEERCGGQFGHIEEILSHNELQDIADRYKVSAGMDVASLNARPSTIARERIPRIA